MRTAWWCAAVAVAVLAAGTACKPISSGGDTAGPTGGGATSTAGAAASGVSGRTSDDDASFCALAKAKAPAYLNVFDGSSSTPAERRAAVADVDALTAAAPAALHDDFERWDKLEHALLDAGDNPSDAIVQQAGGPEIRDSLQRIAAYLKDTCGITADTAQ
jgi:hypothetical protein